MLKNVCCRNSQGATEFLIELKKVIQNSTHIYHRDNKGKMKPTCLDRHIINANNNIRNPFNFQVIYHITINIWNAIEDMCKNEEGQCSYIIELINTIPEPIDLLNYLNQ